MDEKIEGTRRTYQILVPLNMNDMRNELALYTIWYNEFRPHEVLDNRVPQEVNDYSPPCPEPACG